MSRVQANSRNYVILERSHSVDEDEETNEGREDERVRVVAEPREVESYLLTEVHTRRRKYYC